MQCGAICRLTLIICSLFNFCRCVRRSIAHCGSVSGYPAAVCRCLNIRRRQNTASCIAVSWFLSLLASCITSLTNNHGDNSLLAALLASPQSHVQFAATEGAVDALVSALGASDAETRQHAEEALLSVARDGMPLVD